MKLADLDDDFARSLGEFETLDDLRKTIHGDMEDNAQAEAGKALRANLTRSLVNANVFDVPPSLMDKEVRYLTQEYGENLIKAGMSNEKVKELILANEEDLKATAREHVRLMYLVNRIAENEEIETEDSEIRDVVGQAARQMGRPVAELMDQYTEDGTINEITFNIIRNRVYDTILESATIKEVKVKPEETPKEGKSVKGKEGKKSKKKAKRETKK